MNSEPFRVFPAQLLSPVRHLQSDYQEELNESRVGEGSAKCGEEGLQQERLGARQPGGWVFWGYQDYVQP